MSVGQRLWRYALLYKKMIFIALAMLIIAVGTELAGPFVAKKMIDDHILGIESKWYETVEGTDTVFFEGHWYKRNDYFDDNEQKGKEVRILQVDRSFIFVPEPIAIDGVRTYEDGQLTIQKENEVKSYQATIIPAKKMLSFYEPEIPKIIMLLAGYFGLLVISAIFQYGEGFYLQKTANRIIQQMRTDVFAHIQRLPIKYFDQLPAGKVVSRITNDTEAIRELYVTVLATFVKSTIYISGIFIALFILDAKLATICLLLLPILAGWMWIYHKFASTYNRGIRSKLSEINAMINESIQGMTIIQAFRREKEMTEQFDQLNEAHFTFQKKMLNLNALTSYNLVDVVKNLAFVAFIWYFGGGSLGVGSIVSLGLLYAFVDYINRLFEPVANMVNQLANLEQALVAGERVIELLDEQGIPVQDERIERYRGDVSFRSVYFGYQKGEYVLRNISFEAKQGETVALVGHTGSGKSSIMNLLFRFYDTNKGEILIDGKEIQTIPHQMVREHMGIVLQDPYLFTGTIASNVSLQDERISREKVEAALRAVGAEKVFQHLENGYDEPVIEKGSTLSSGQRQLISFARALAFDPAILILDEATSSIDTETEAIIQEAMEVLKKGRTTFIIAHRLSTIKNADQILVLDQGEIIEKGNHEELMLQQGRYYQMYQLQQG
ncbi:multidrug ABC transporter permease [Bacillaceae bacterium SAOS 7]|nr:multidrug ABC transporter permease [Bacillaceae bacterium SAOS 7]